MVNAFKQMKMTVALRDTDTLLVALIGFFSVEFLTGWGGVLLTFTSLIYVIIKIIQTIITMRRDNIEWKEKRRKGKGTD